MQTTLTALGEMFEAARSIMSWLGDCAKVHLLEFMELETKICWHMLTIFFVVCIPVLIYLFAIICFDDFGKKNLGHLQIVAMENQPVRWSTPLGLPVVQPYRKLGRHLVMF